MNVINKDITTIESGILLNGVNCQGVMGSGVAKAYIDKWPIVRDDYLLWDKEDMYLGKVDLVTIEYKKLYVANCWTQEFYGYDGKKYADAGALLACISKCALLSKRMGLSLYTPLIGCGLGGLDKGLLMSIVNTVETINEIEITVVEY